MAGMFYSLEEVVEQLSLTEEQVTQLVKDGKLKEFRDGDKVLFKVKQVQQLAAESEDVVELTEDEDELIPLTDDDDEDLAIDGDLSPAMDDDDADLAIDDVLSPAMDDDDADPAIDGDLSPVMDDDDADLAIDDVLSPATADDEDDLDIEGLNLDISSEGSSIELLLDETMEKTGDLDVLSEDTAPPAPSISGLGEDIDLAELSGADTNVGTTGINVLADTDDEYKLTSDTKSETAAFDADSTGIGSLDDDLNMDSIGSGSGLLDLSLQADDTSLGAVLDDILPAAGEAAEAPLTAEESHMAEEADKIFEEAGDSAVIPQVSETRAMGQYFEPAPDKVSNACGIMLVIPFLALIYAVIVVLMGTKGISPPIVSFAASDGPMGMAIIWLIVISLSIISLLIFAVAALTSGKGEKEDTYQQV